MIPKETINEIKAIAQLDLVIGDYLSIKKSGSTYKAKCPFHDDNKPSLRINVDKGFYKCFVCDAGGDAFTFLQNYQHMSFREAAQTLADRFGITLPNDSKSSRKKDPDKHQKALKTLFSFYRQQLEEYQHHVLAAFGIEDLIAGEQTVPLGYSGLADVKDFAANNNISINQLYKLGILNGAGNERFCGCLVIPVYSISGKISGLYGYGEDQHIVTRNHRFFSSTKSIYGLEQIDRSNRTAWLHHWPEQSLKAKINQPGNNHIAAVYNYVTPEKAIVISRYIDTVHYMHTDVYQYDIQKSIKNMNAAGLEIYLNNREWLHHVLNNFDHDVRLHGILKSLISAYEKRLDRAIYTQFLHENFNLKS